MKRTIIALAACALILPAAASPRHVHEMTAMQWRDLCTANVSGRGTSDDAPARCQARALGEIDGVVIGMRLSKGTPWICMPDDVGGNVRVMVLRKYLHDHPEALSEDFGEGVAAALADAYPCHIAKR